MTSYATPDQLYEFCPQAEDLNEEELELALERASRDVDSLTWNRIVERGFDDLTAFQQQIITQTVCRLAMWQTEQGELLDSPLSGYSINGVSAQFGASQTVAVQNGVMIPKRLCRLLEQTGLCCGRL